MKVAITIPDFSKDDISPLNILYERGIYCVQNARGRILEPAEIIPLIKDCEGIITGNEAISAAIMALSPRLKVISIYGNKCDAVDVEYAGDHGISVVTTDYKVTDAEDLAWQCVQNLCRELYI